MDSPRSWRRILNISFWTERKHSLYFVVFCSQVSWIRQRDLHILTTMMITYTGDERFHVVHPEQSEDWDLRVEYVQPRDQGIYECQVNTDPKISLAVMLNVKGKTAGWPTFFIKIAACSHWTPQNTSIHLRLEKCDQLHPTNFHLRVSKRTSGKVLPTSLLRNWYHSDGLFFQVFSE